MRARAFAFTITTLLFGAFVLCVHASSSSSWEEHRAIAEETYALLEPCLKFSDNRVFNFEYPKDAVAHYQELLQISAQYRGIEPHKKDSYGLPERLEPANAKIHNKHKQSYVNGDFNISYVSLRGYYSILWVSYFMWSGLVY